MSEPSPPSPYPVKCLALDIGGVVCADTWETIFGNGLARYHGLSVEAIRMHGDAIWNRHAYTTSREEAYWADWEAALGHPLDRRLIAALQAAHVWVDRSALSLIERCLATGIEVCFVSNSTAFWFAMQMRESGIDRLLRRMAKPYLSHEIGYPKAHADGGLAQLARDRDPATTLFVDDRVANIDRARQLGMQTLHYERRDGTNLEQVLSARLFA